MGEVQPGNILFDERGQPCQVTFVSDVMYGRKCYAVEFDDGTVIVADAEHQWLTSTHAARKAAARRGSTPNTRLDHQQCRPRPECEPQVRTTVEIKKTLLYANREKNHSIDVCQPIVTLQPSGHLAIDPYLFGVWLGDGDSRDAILTSADEDLINSIRDAGHFVGEGKEDRRGNKSLRYPLGARNQSRKDSFRGAIKRIGVWQNKHIPMMYLRANERQRLELLAGLMDTDGSVTSGGHCEFTNTNERLAKDTYELICSLGFKAGWIEDRAKCNGKDCGPRYRITFTPHRPVFRLKRKLERQHFGKSQAKKVSRRYIVDIRETESVPVRCIQVDSPNSLFLCSRSFIPTHNTRICAEDTWWYAASNDNARIGVVAPTNDDLRKTCFEGESGVLACCPPELLLGGKAESAYNKSTKEIRLWNGSILQGFSSDAYQRLRGPQFHRGWCEELAAWPRLQETWDMLQFTLRLGMHPQLVISTTPKPFKLIKELSKRSGVYKVSGSTYENKGNLAPSFLDEIEKQYNGTRIGQQELYGLILEDTPGALWTWKMIQDARYAGVAPTEWVYLVVSLDPSVGDGNPDNDTCGLVAAGLAKDGYGYLLCDRSLRGTPNEWVKAAIDLYRELGAHWIIAESNNGGSLISSLIHAADSTVPVRLVHASQGKRTRAEPVSMLYEQGRIRHFGVFSDLETELTEWSPELSDYSPGRMDATVWAFTALMVERASDFFCEVA